MNSLRRGGAALLLWAALAANLTWSTPQYNWDMVPYVAIAHELNGTSPLAAHARTYAELSRSLDERTRTQLTGATRYRAEVATDADAFRAQLPVYRMKVAYPWLLSKLMQAGANPVHASVWISRVAYLVAGLVLLGWLMSVVPFPLALAGAWLFMALPFAIELAELSTPDALSTAVVLAALWLLLERKQPRLSLLLLSVSLLIRPDNIAWLLAAAAFLFVRRPALRRFTAATVAVGMAVVVLLGIWSGAPGGIAWFHHSFVARITDYAAFEPLSPLDYLRVYVVQTHPANLPDFLLLFALIGSLLWLRTKDAALLVLGGFAVLHWAMFPDGDRFFVPAYLTVLVLLVRTLGVRPNDGSDAEQYQYRITMR